MKDEIADMLTVIRSVRLYAEQNSSSTAFAHFSLRAWAVWAIG